MISMSLKGDVSTTFGTISVEIQESPSLPSPGETTIADLGGGLWEIDSFFDVFTERTLSGGPFASAFTLPSGDSARVTLQGAVPEPGTLALLGMGGLVLLCRRRG
jgi:hypothetical protein